MVEDMLLAYIKAFEDKRASGTPAFWNTELTLEWGVGENDWSVVDIGEILSYAINYGRMLDR